MRAHATSWNAALTGLLVVAAWAPLPAEAGDPAELDPDRFQRKHGPHARLGLAPEWILYGFNEDGGGAVSSGGAGFNLSYAPRHPQNLRIATAYVGALFGAFGDNRHSPAHLQAGWKPRMPIYHGDLVELYGGPRVLYTLSALRGAKEDVAHSVSFGEAIGIGFFDNLVALELTGEAVYAASDEFRAPGDVSTTLWKPRVTASALVDICFLLGQRGTDESACRYAPTQSRYVDLTVALFAAMADLGTERAAACAAADKAVSLFVRDTCPGYEADGFLCRLHRLVADPPLQARVDQAASSHRALQACFAKNRADAVVAAREGWQLRDKMQYAPYPPELRRAMGCEGAEVELPPPPPSLPESPHERLARLAAERERAEEGAARAERAAERAERALEDACEACPAACRGRGWAPAHFRPATP